jgi:hypothetical protein
MLRQRAALLLLPLAAALAVPAAARAQESSMRGTFVIDRAHSDDVNRAIETAVARMSFVTRPIARGRLRRTNTVYQRVVLNFTQSEVSTTFDQRRAITSPANGQPVEWTREDGEKFQLSTSWENETCRGEDRLWARNLSGPGPARKIGGKPCSAPGYPSPRTVVP